jgi:hypothetical protein
VGAAGEAAAGGIYCCLAHFSTPAAAVVDGAVPAVAGVVAALAAVVEVAALAVGLAGEARVAVAPEAAGKATRRNACGPIWNFW